MSRLEHLIRHESPHSGLAFRSKIYRAGEEAALVIDCLALANAELERGSRFLFLGVDDEAGGERRLIGVDRERLLRFKRQLLRLLAQAVEPQLIVRLRAVELDGRLIGYIQLMQCVSPPYLCKAVVGGLKPGMGYVRRGIRNLPLSRADMQRMFAQSQLPSKVETGIRVGFAGAEFLDRLTLPALEVNKLPSELAAERIRAVLTANEHSRDIFGRTETQFSRLMHAKLYGMDSSFEKHSDDSLVLELENIEHDYQTADEHYLYEVRAHQLNLVVANDGPNDLHAGRLRLSLPRLSGAGVADRIYTDSDTVPMSAGYPKVTVGERSVRVEAALGTLAAQRTARVFREPIRFWARDAAAGRTLPLDYELTAEELSQPVRGTLLLHIEKAGLRSV